VQGGQVAVSLGRPSVAATTGLGGLTLGKQAIAWQTTLVLTILQ